MQNKVREFQKKLFSIVVPRKDYLCARRVVKTLQIGSNEKKEKKARNPLMIALFGTSVSFPPRCIIHAATAVRSIFKRYGLIFGESYGGLGKTD